MTETTKKLVDRLRTLSVDDREWLMCQLSVDERRQILAALAGDSETAAGLDATNLDGVALAARASEGACVLAMEFVELDCAKAEDIALLLADEADWTVVVLLGYREWSWAEAYLRRMSPLRLSALRDLSTVLGKTIRPRVARTVVGIIADRLRVADQATTLPSLFDLVLENAQRERAAERATTGESA